MNAMVKLLMEDTHDDWIDRDLIRCISATGTQRQENIADLVERLVERNSLMYDELLRWIQILKQEYTMAGAHAVLSDELPPPTPPQESIYDRAAAIAGSIRFRTPVPNPADRDSKRADELFSPPRIGTFDGYTSGG